MNYKQLINPNLSVVGQPEMCLSYVESVFGASHLYPYAYAAYEKCAYKHTDTPPANVSVPIWFNGGTYGHVAVWHNGTIYSTTAQGDKTFSSISALNSYIGSEYRYLGWSEDVADKRIVEPAPAVKTLFLPASNPTWRIYKVGGPYTVGHEIAKLAPAKFGGLTYTIEATLAPNVYEIKTQDFGNVAIYAGPDTNAQVRTT